MGRRLVVSYTHLYPCVVVVSRSSGADVIITVTLVLSDVDFAKLISGKANAQKLFMSGKLKIRGDVMKATKMEPILKKAQTKAKL